MHTVYLVLFLFASVYAESVRETETWMPSSPHGDLVASGDSPNGSDFGFPDEAHATTVDDEDDHDDEDDYDYEASASGAEEPTEDETDVMPPSKPELIDNRIPDGPLRPKPTVNERVIVIESNEVGMGRPHAANVQMTHSGDESIFNKTEVLAAVIAGAAVGLLFAVLLIFLLFLFIYRMKKKDEGSYELGKKPIYKKAPTTEIYA